MALVVVDGVESRPVALAACPVSRFGGDKGIIRFLSPESQPTNSSLRPMRKESAASNRFTLASHAAWMVSVACQAWTGLHCPPIPQLPIETALTLHPGFPRVRYFISNHSVKFGNCEQSNYGERSCTHRRAGDDGSGNHDGIDNLSRRYRR